MILFVIKGYEKCVTERKWGNNDTCLHCSDIWHACVTAVLTRINISLY